MYTFCAILYVSMILGKDKCQAKQTKCIIKLDLNTCYNTSENTSISHIGCQEADICQREINISHIKLEPYSFEIVTDLLRACCGNCVNISKVKTLKKLSEVAHSSVSTSDFVFPVLGLPKTLTLYGYYFLPLVETPSIYYITNKSDDLIRQLIHSCINMWPLVIIFLLMIIMSGFIGWLMETWYNKSEFPRPLFVGWFEGIWWSFISMTTVGYGDKVPKSVPARLFSIAWIFIGITTFSLVTAMLSSEIIEANSLPPPTMTGSKIAAMRNRLYDAIVVAKNGGVLIQIRQINATDGIHQMVLMLKNKHINGFVLDKYTMLLFNRVFENTATHKNVVNFLKTKTVRTEISHTGEQFFYGVLVRNLNDYDFLAEFIKDNRVVLNTCNSLLINKYSSEGKEDQVRNPLFSTSGDIFWSSFITIIIIIIVMFCFGMLYELMRKRKIRILCRKKTVLVTKAPL